MHNPILPGLTYTLSLEIDDRLPTPPHTFGLTDPSPVFATAFLAGFMEWACIEALELYLEDGRQTVGTHIHLSHAAPTPMSKKVTAEVKLVEVKGGALRFRVDCYDECDLIGSGVHERMVIDTTRFMDKLRRQAA